MSDRFYELLPTFNDFSRITDPAIFTPLPSDWYIAVSDIKNSTIISQHGGYKDVNLIGASTIMAVLNIQRKFSLPFVFGGDGATICIPGAIVPQCRKALAGTRKMAKESFGIDLRVGIVPVQYIRQNNFDVLVAKCQFSPSYSQPVFIGGGLQFAEDQLKSGARNNEYFIEFDEKSVADFSGLECRWKSVKSDNGEMVSLIVQAMGETAAERSAAYQKILSAIHAIYGDDSTSHPIREQHLTMSMSEQYLYGESRIRSFGKGIAERLIYWWKIRWNVLLGKILMSKRITTKQYDWGSYKQRLIANTDYKKFDDKLRQMLSGSKSQRNRLQDILEEEYRAGRIVYGLHFAESALVTCILFDYGTEHVHLVDAENGGYAVAASQLKQRLGARK